MTFGDFFGYAFVHRALIAGIFVALLCSTLGVILVLRRLSLIGDGLAHVTFGSVALGLLLQQNPLFVSLPVVALCSFGILRLTERGRLYGDAAIGIVSALGIGGGVLMASIAGGFNVDLFSYLFGNILSVSAPEVVVSVIFSLAVLAIICIFYSDIFATTCDPEFAKVAGIRIGRINMIIALLTSVTVVLTMKVVGIMLTSSLLIIPAVTALQIARSFKKTMIIASCLGVASVIFGIVISFIVNLPTGAVIVMVNLFFFIVIFFCRNKRNKQG
jgi:zinc transport system permease protein